VCPSITDLAQSDREAKIQSLGAPHRLQVRCSAKSQRQTSLAGVIVIEVMSKTAGLLEQAKTGSGLLVAWSANGDPVGVRRSSGFPFFLPTGGVIEESTFAAACFAEEKVLGRPRAVPAPGTHRPDLDSAVKVLEQSKALPTYRCVISLLWIEDREPAER